MRKCDALAGYPEARNPRYVGPTLRALPKIGLLSPIAIRNRMMAIGKMGAQPNTSAMTYIANHCYRRLVIFIRETKMMSSD